MGSHRRSAAVALCVTGLGLAGALSACGSKTASTTTQPPTTLATTTVAATTTTLSAAELTSRLLTSADIGGGWTPAQDITAADLGGLGESPCENVAINPTIAARLVASVGVILKPDDGTPRGIKETVVIGEPDRLARDLDAVFGAATDNCIGKDLTTKDGEKVRMQTFVLPDVGDQRSAISVTVGEPPDFRSTWKGHQAIIRLGSIAVAITEFEVVGSPDQAPRMSDAQFVQLVQQAAAKLTA